MVGPWPIRHSKGSRARRVIGWRLQLRSFAPVPSAAAGRRGLRGTPQRLTIHPPVADTAEDEHDFIHLGVDSREPEVFAFPGDNMRR